MLLVCLLNEGMEIKLYPNMVHSNKNIANIKGEMHDLEPETAANKDGRKHRTCMSPEEEDLIQRLHHLLGDRWQLIAERLPNRKAKEVKIHWRMMEKRKSEERKLYKPACSRVSPSFRFTMDEPAQETKPEHPSPLEVAHLHLN